MGILEKARKLESTLTRTVDRAAQQLSRSGPRGPLEIRRAVLEAIEEQLEPAGRGTHVFPFNRIKLSVVAATRDARARLAGVLDEEPTLRERVSDRLRQLGCQVRGLQVKIAYMGQPEPEWMTPEFHVEFDRSAVAELERVERPGGHELRLTIASGSADKQTYALALDRINLGRCADVRDTRNRLIRTNHVVFKDGDTAVNGTVSRCHAHIEYSGRTRDYRISDDRSAQGTSILRDGKTIGVPAGSRGVRLRSGDEVILGEARLRVRIADTD
jgi:hypothetical protein